MIWVLGLGVWLCVLFAGIAIFSAWNGCRSIGFMGNAEQANIINGRFVDGSPAGDTLKVTVANTGGLEVTIWEGYLNGIKSSDINKEQAFIIPKASSLEITLTFPNDTVVYGTQNVKLTTTKGTSIVYSWLLDSANTTQYDPLNDVAALPVPILKTVSTPWQDWSTSQKTAVAVSSVVTVAAVLGACKISHYIVGPKNKTELFILLFLVSVIVVSAAAAIVNIIFFPLQISYMISMV
jgi:hypothetical protein